MIMATLVKILSVTLLWSFLGNAYRILVVFPVPGKSHSILGDGYVKNLLEAGHEITYITPFPRKNPPPNLHQVEVTINFPDMLNLQKILDKELDVSDSRNLVLLLRGVAAETVSDSNVQKLIHDPNHHFDVVIVEWLLSDLYCGFSAVFDTPYIWSSSMDPHWAILRLIDDIPNPAYTSGVMSPNLLPFSFMQRVNELKTLILGLGFKYFNMNEYENQAYLKWFGPAIAKKGKPVPLFDELRYNASLVIGNSHPSLGQAVRIPQNYVGIGGYHIHNDTKPLPEDLKKIMDKAKHGVIYFSMGSNLKSKDFPEVLKKNLLNMLGQLKHTVLWKFEEILDDIPKNVHLLKWSPQQSILSHPNCKIFITHGGLLSTTEAVHYGVPIIGIPAFADQFANINQAVSKGYGNKVELSYSLAEDLKLAIEDVLSHSRYTEKVKELSFIYHNRPVSPGKELVHWVEHVVKTGGAPHLRSPALMVPWYQKMYLDLLSVFLLMVFVLLVSIKQIV